jgi:Holliday junction resolvase RusA-like endonuclease
MIQVVNGELHIMLKNPISINEAIAWKTRRHKSDKYESFETYVEIEFLKTWEKFEIKWDSWLQVDYKFYFSLYTKEWNKRIKDVFNYEKCLTDTLSKNIKWFEDHKIKKWSVEKIDSDKNFVKIIIKEIYD